MPDDEEIAAGAFGDLAGRVHHDRFVGAVLGRFVLGQRGVHIRAGELAATGNGGIRNAHPGGDDRLLAAIEREIVAHRHLVDGELIADAAQARRELHRRLVDERANVDVATRGVLLGQLGR